MINLLIAILLAALFYSLCLALGQPTIIAVVVAIVVLIAGIGGTNSLRL